MKDNFLKRKAKTQQELPLPKIEKSNSEEDAITLLKSLGYKILKPYNEFKEI